MGPTRLIVGLTLALLGAALFHQTAQAEVRVECGQVLDYTAPDSGAGTPGSLALGFDPAFVISAAAVISPQASTFLTTSTDSGPTCFEATFDDGTGDIVALDLAPSGSVCGSAVLDGGHGFYVVGGRFIVPPDVVPQIAGLQTIALAEASGEEICVTFQLRPSGPIAGFRAVTEMSGTVTQGPGMTYRFDGDSVDLALAPEPVLSVLNLVSGRGEFGAVEFEGTGTIDAGTGDITSTLAYGARAERCTAVLVSGDVVTVQGTAFALTPGSSVAAGVTQGSQLAIRVAPAGTLHLSVAPGLPCGGGADETPVVTPTPTPMPTPMPSPTVIPAAAIVGTVPSAGFALLVVGQDTTPQELAGRLVERGCRIEAIWVLEAGRWRGYVPAAPSFVNRAFPAVLNAGDPFVARCR